MAKKQNKSKLITLSFSKAHLIAALFVLGFGAVGGYALIKSRAMLPADGGTAAASYYDCPYTTYPTLKYGASNNTACVKHLQWTLAYLYPDRGGQYITKIDGVFGASTKKAVQVFQYVKKVPNSGCTAPYYTSCDGVVGQATWYELEPDYGLIKTVIKLLQNP